ncbi:PPE domain-containing protein [Saccharothrix sp. S26]|uniref:PPE domain-containing protein n=1 Tax=Saccharothrix sp. S26 TaxID=2907215 RepID=UPI001F333427|nr:PPE domain-containing protein [Saccharothrix sp. S26]MCE6995683.1 PPE domain-containing protein [Saccharothrix sp. S26]
MTGFREIKDFRFQGYDNSALAALVQRFSTGDAAQKFSDASHALRRLAATLADTDETLRTELKKLGIDWQGAAGDNAGQAVTVSAATATSGTEAAQQNSKATAVQGATYSQTRNGMPEPQKLRGDTETSFGDEFLGFFGHETDHAKQVKETQAAREQAIRGLEQYTEASRDALSQYQGMNRPPQFEVTTASSVSTPIAAVGQPGGPVPGIPGGVPGGLPGGVPGGLPGQVPGGSIGLPPQVPGMPGGSTGLLPTTPGGSTVLPPAALGIGKPGGSNFGLGLGLGLAGGLGLGIAATQARGGRVVRNLAPAMPGGAKVPEGPAGGKGTGGGGGGKGGVPGMPGTLTGKPGISATIGAIDPDERVPGRGAGAAGKAGAGNSMMQPAASAKGGPGEEDGEHVRKYGVDSDDVFGDERMVVQSVIGDDEPEKK